MSKPGKVTPQKVRKIARLARLSLSEDEVSTYTRQFNQILEYMDRLNEVDTSDVEPLSHVLDLVNVSRPDEPAPSLDRATVMDNAPETDKEHIAVPPAIKRSN